MFFGIGESSGRLWTVRRQSPPRKQGTKSRGRRYSVVPGRNGLKLPHLLFDPGDIAGTLIVCTGLPIFFALLSYAIVCFLMLRLGCHVKIAISVGIIGTLDCFWHNLPLLFHFGEPFEIVFPAPCRKVKP